MPYSLLWRRLLLLAWLGVFTADSPPAAHAQSAPPSPFGAAKLRHLLPLPEATIRPRIELSIGLNYSPKGGSELRRDSSDYAAQIVQVKRKMTGRLADAPRYITLGCLYHAVGLDGKSTAAFRRSEEVCRLALRRHPNDGFALAEYGRTLSASGRPAESAMSLKNAAKIAPKSADVWLALGSILAGRISPSNEPKTHFARDAAAAYDQAILLAPRDPAVWAARGNFRDWVLPSLHGKLISRAGLNDYERVAALSPRDPYAQAQVPTIDCFTFELAHQMFTSPKAAEMEPAESDHRAEMYLRRIAAIAKDTNGAQKAKALTARAWVQFEFFYDPHGAQKSLRLALQQNPSQQDAIDYQMHVAAVTGDYVLLAAACRHELRRRPAARLRVLLAYADYYLAQQKPVYRQEGLSQLERAHTAEPRDYAITLGLAAFLLEKGQTPRATLLLAQIAPEVPKRSKEQQVEYDVTRGIGSALVGDSDSARYFLTLARKNDPKNQSAASALALLPAASAADIQTINAGSCRSSCI